MSNLDPMSIRNHIYNSGYGYGYGHTQPRKTVTPWQKRIASHTGYSADCGDWGSHSEDITLTFINPETGYEYELEVTVFAEYEPGQNGGWDDPSWEGYFHSPVAVWYRPGHGWKGLDLTKEQEETVIDHFASREPDYDGPDPDDYYGHHYDY